MKIWKRLHYIRTLSKYENRKIRIGVLGCMAERLKEQLLNGQCPDSLSRRDIIGQSNCNTSQRPRVLSIGADFVCGPDAYRDLPRLIEDSYAGIQGASVALSMEETYADVAPIRLCRVVESESCQPQSRFSPCAFLSVMRGCDNMCTYCIVPFVRGRERSRPLYSILDEAQQLFDEGVREITLLGQNVNSYCDRSGKLDQSVNLQQQTISHCSLTPGFRTVYRLRNGGLRFADLLDQVSRISPELRIRFTSPHPKDFPTEMWPSRVISLPVFVGKRKKITPKPFVSSGTWDIPSSSVTPTVCERKHARTVAFGIEAVGREISLQFNQSQIGHLQLVLVEGTSRRSSSDVYGRNDFNTKVILSRVVPTETASGYSVTPVSLEPGDYVAVEVSMTENALLIA
ncbi:hypothetical protein AHF37_07174 [Paragonimus kellicotti]|nr:hypothetical protein AHF37_07174 [Paragonimus kellicotti]